MVDVEGRALEAPHFVARVELLEANGALRILEFVFKAMLLDVEAEGILALKSFKNLVSGRLLCGL